ncbi:MAG: heparinase II/III-family protein [Firmicutes bacterium]|nr:heparinase II/III-family protein [Bacillota bacterium]
MFLNRQTTRLLREKVHRDATCRKGYTAVIRQAEIYLSEVQGIGLGQVDVDRALLPLSHPVSKAAAAPSGEAKMSTLRGGGFVTPYHEMLLFLGFAYRLAGDRRFAEGARSLMELLAALPVWERTWTDRVPNWHATGAASTMSMAFGTCLSWLSDFLSRDDTRRLASALVEKGVKPVMDDWILPGKRIHCLDSMGHNFFPMALGGAGVGALAVRAFVPQAMEWVRLINAALLRWYEYWGNVLQNKPANFGEDGGYYEGLGYAGVIDHLLWFADAYERTVGESPLLRVPQLRLMPEFFLYNSYVGKQGLWGVNFCDFVSTDWVSERNDRAYALMLYLAGFFRDRRLRWFAGQMRKFPREPIGLLWYDDTLRPLPPTNLPTSRTFLGVGLAVLRDSWKRDATVFALRSGVTWTHAHADAGSFVLWSRGRQLVIDSGSVNYHRPEFAQYYLQRHAHNVVLLDGRSQPVEDIYRGCKHRGSIPVSIDAGSYKYVLADATGPGSSVFQRWHRHVLWIHDSIVLIDDLLGHVPGVFEWLLHIDGIATSTADREIVVENGQACLRVSVAWPEQFQWELRHGYRERDRSLVGADVPPERLPYYVLRARPQDAFNPPPEYALTATGVREHLDITGREEKIITVFTPYDKGNEDELPEVLPIHDKDVKGLRLREGSREVSVFFNLLADGRIMHHNSINEFEGVVTDAAILTVSRDLRTGNVERYCLHNGSILRVAGRPVFESWVKADLVLDYNPSGWQMKLASRKSMWVGIGSGAQPKKLLINGRIFKGFTFDSEHGLVRLEVPEADVSISANW